MKTIYLKNHVDTVRAECLRRNDPLTQYDYSEALINQAIAAQIENNLRYRDGKTYDRCFGLASEYVNKSDVPHYTNDSEAATWEFSGHVRNSASRINRGHTAI